MRGTAVGLRLLPALFGAVGTRAVEAAGEPDADGRRVIDLEVETLPVAVSDLLGIEAEVLGPPELRAEPAGTVTGLAQRYA